ncbi:hypothetical protein LSH36_1939g00005 [Paralvinella palmiformis]|uniref:Uncharacterized protein n=1 Tax=Paralvinella palmiformis TaxID=53620 RepID=A0AAD9IQM9_9ANNE|nr:hypothetical protein LSH36_1939g00005 [Paralvinella palmiformis]
MVNNTVGVLNSLDWDQSRLSDFMEETSLKAVLLPRRLRTLVWIFPKFETILSMDSDEAGSFMSARHLKEELSVARYTSSMQQDGDSCGVFVFMVRNAAIGCKATVKEDVFPPGAVEHSHSPTLSITEAGQFRAKIRTEAKLHQLIPGSQIVELALHEHLGPEPPCPSLPNPVALAR